IEVVENQKDLIISYKYESISETLQRIAFNLSAVLSNKNSIIILEEPESNLFPFYISYLAEKIAFDRFNNQYFITTHNPYFLLRIIEKTIKKDLSVFLTYSKDYQSHIKKLNEGELEEILDSGADAFFEITKFMEDEE
ncbi:MAG: AAA family ATPase, partial [Candidatus Helarchaeota archaeon]